MMKSWISVFSALCAFGSTIVFAADDAPLVAAASNLQFAMPAIVKAYETETGKTVKVTFGSSGQFATQIANGAPFDVFLSADEAMVHGLVAQGLTVDDGRLYALGLLAFYVPLSSTIKVDAHLEGLKEALRAGNVSKFAIASPQHAPYGRAAREALQSAGLWAEIEPNLVIGENVSQALQFVTEGGASAGLVPLSLLVAPAMTAKGQHVIVSDALVKPLPQSMVVLKRAGPAANAFASFITSQKGQAILAKFGFSSPAGT
ncbi:MAG: molybdate ABC transporter substrate-binding protein [Hyphomicrobium sp.]|nr:MAG: molybdate ABC transporter substrate-binding protein [Hyphomicrobium sp.]PPD01693.1 MAG: molybdate ABC transporter substrate-binding protein [Hyphomicrobium sp.]